MLDPQKIVTSFKLEPGDHVADFGSGHGYFTIPLSRAVGHEGKVYAIDIQRSLLDVVRAKAKIENLLNIEFIWANLEALGGSKIKSDFADFVLIGNILYQAEQKENIIKEAHRILRSGGILAVIEWEKESGQHTGLGPAHELRVSREDTTRMCQSILFADASILEVGSHHYALLFKKK